jgi:hypothetical protein
MVCDVAILEAPGKLTGCFPLLPDALPDTIHDVAQAEFPK